VASEKLLETCVLCVVAVSLRQLVTGHVLLSNLCFQSENIDVVFGL